MGKHQTGRRVNRTPQPRTCRSKPAAGVEFVDYLSPIMVGSSRLWYNGEMMFKKLTSILALSLMALGLFTPVAVYAATPAPASEVVEAPVPRPSGYAWSGCCSDPGEPR